MGKQWTQVLAMCSTCESTSVYTVYSSRPFDSTYTVLVEVGKTLTPVIMGTCHTCSTFQPHLKP